MLPDHVLDNSIWNALVSHQDGLAVGDARARRFPANIGPLSGMADQSSESYASLARLAKPDEQLVLFLNELVALPPTGWQADVTGLLTQMVLDAPLPSEPVPSMELLGEDDIPEMLTLTELTKPGPFRQRTIDLGRYIGIREGGRLVAMAGERLHLEGYTEISAVCTHPDAQGKGYARALMVDVANHILQRGETPFLHAFHENFNAIRVYERLGFRQRRLVHLAVLRPCPVAV